MKASVVDYLYINPGHSRLTLDVYGDIRETIEAVQKATVEFSMKKYRQKRSLDANAYMWVLIDKLAEATDVPCKDIYFDQLKNVGGNMEKYCSIPEAVDKMVELWKQQGSTGWGWPYETYESKIPGCVNLKLWYGSSTFDTATMARLIDHLVQDCKAVGIETMPPDELNALIREWK